MGADIFDLIARRAYGACGPRERCALSGRYEKMLSAIFVFATSSVQCIAADDSFRDFKAAYGCDIVERLKLIYSTGDPARPLNRYLAIAEPGRDYVQCIFYDLNRRVLCEASSGFWKTKRGHERTFYQTPQTISALARLGFDTDDRAGNFRIHRSVTMPTNFAFLADLMLRALHDAYGARSNSKLTFNAPFAPYRPSVCNPVS